MSQFDLTEDQLQIQEMARKFTSEVIAPFAAEADGKHIFPRDTIREAAELGFGAIYVSEESGGIGLGRLEAALIMEAMAYGCPSTSAFISIHNMASWMIDRFGSDELKQKYLPPLIPMEKIASYCLTEPSSGSDAAALKTKAVKDGDHYVVSGSKAFISGGGENEIYVCMVRTGEDGPKGISALVIEKGMPGVSFGANGDALRPRPRFVGGRPRAPAAWRLRLSDGLSDRALLARPSRSFDPGGHQPGDADDRRARADPPVTSAFSFEDLTRQLHDAAEKMMKGEVKPALPFDPFAIAQATGEFAFGLAMKPDELMEVQLAAARQWGDFWT